MTEKAGPGWGLIVLVPSTFLATALLIGGGIAALLEPRIEFSLFVGIPVGLLAGVVVSGGVAAGLVAGDSLRRQIAMGVAGFSLAVLVSFAVTLLVLDIGVVIAIALSLLIGLAGGGFGLLRGQPRLNEQPDSNNPV